MSAAALPASTIAELRLGRVAQIGFSGILSGIDKQTTGGRWPLGLEGLAGDQQAESFHGGREKAVLQYDRDHYANWAADFPALVEKFVPGGFGENLVVPSISEADICVGDYVRAGTAILQVSESRQPCFKLNHRFGNGSIARHAQMTGRTGWLYRVIEPGEAAPGDAIRVIDRPLAAWSITRLQRYLYDIVDDLEVAAELAELPHLSPGFRSLFAKRVESGRAEAWEGRLSNGTLATRATVWFEAEIAEVRDEAEDVKSYRLVRADGRPLPSFTAGAHLDVKVRNALTRSYSICHLPDGIGYRIAVRRATGGQGGSEHIHQQWRPGDRLLASEPRNHFELSSSAPRHLLICGGIGVTPFLSMIEALEARREPWELHYSMRDVRRAPFAAELLARFPQRVFMHESGGEASRRLDVARLLGNAPLGTHAYCCGPAELMAEVRRATADWPNGVVHFEAFTAPAPQGLADCSAFDVTIASTGASLTVEGDATLLNALEAQGFHIPSSCGVGTCGTCKIRYLSGQADHRDMCLSTSARSTWLTPCVSRGKETTLSLDL